MIAQTTLPPSLPFSILDYGLTALALIAMVAIVYLFLRLANAQHKAATEAFDKMTDLLESLTNIAREMGHELQGTQHELARVHEEVWRNRELINRGLDRAAVALQVGEELQQHLAESLKDDREMVSRRTQEAKEHEAGSRAAHQEHRDWRDADQDPKR